MAHIIVVKAKSFAVLMFSFHAVSSEHIYNVRKVCKKFVFYGFTNEHKQITNHIIEIIIKNQIRKATERHKRRKKMFLQTNCGIGIML